MLIRNPHRPAHLLLDNTAYFITGSIYQKRPLIDNTLKPLLLNIIHEEFNAVAWILEHWVILDNHYHIMVTSNKGQDLPKIIGRFHYKSGKLIRKKYSTNSPIWWNYWDYCPRNEKDYLTRLNYLFNNPIKHGYVQNLRDYPFSSFHSMLKKQGQELLRRQFKDHSDYKNLILDEDDF
jgi:putative transposase